jgi:succinyl-CoA synthetase beta subunit
MLCRASGNQWANGSRHNHVTGNAILEQAKIEVPEEAESLVDAFDEWVANGDIMAKGRGKAGAHYIKAYRNLLVEAVHLMERGQARKAYMKLMMAQKMSRHLA